MKDLALLSLRIARLMRISARFTNSTAAIGSRGQIGHELNLVTIVKKQRFLKHPRHSVLQFGNHRTGRPRLNRQPTAWNPERSYQIELPTNPSSEFQICHELRNIVFQANFIQITSYPPSITSSSSPRLASGSRKVS